MYQCLFLGDSITDADHLFDSDGLGFGYVSCIAHSLKECSVKNKGQNGFTVEQLLRMILRDGIEPNWDFITILIGVNDIPVELYTSHKRLPDEFFSFYDKLLSFISNKCSGKILLIEPFLFDYPEEFKLWHSYIELESRLIQKLAKKHHCLFLPVDQILRKNATEHGVKNVTIDGIHLTSYGNRILSDLWISKFQDFISS